MEIDVLKKKLGPLFQEYQVQKAILFGSLARNDGSRHKQTELRFLDRYQGILASIGKALPEWDVDLLIYTPEELAQISERHFIRQALAEGKVLYESK